MKFSAKCMQTGIMTLQSYAAPVCPAWLPHCGEHASGAAIQQLPWRQIATLWLRIHERCAG